MYRRKIQLIAGTTYTVSLPKEWVKKNKLKEKKEILMQEQNDDSLVIFPEFVEQGSLEEIRLNVDNYPNNIGQVLFAVYYFGFETISLYSKKDFEKSVKARIRKVLTHMSGTEVTYEDKNNMTIRVLLDKSRVDIIQTIYRITLLIESSISNMLGKIDVNEIRINENEIDRLYHLLTKIISMSLVDANILHSSNIINISLVPSFFLMSKRLEHIGDNINHLSEHIHTRQAVIEKKEKILNFIKTELSRCVKYLLGNKKTVFERAPVSEIRLQEKLIENVRDTILQQYLEDVLRFLMDIEEEVVTISVYSRLIDNKAL